MPGSAPQQPAQGEPAPAQHAVHGQRVDSVGAAARVEATRRWQRRRDPLPVQPQCTDQHPGHQLRRFRTRTSPRRGSHPGHVSSRPGSRPSNRPNAASRSRSSAALDAAADAGSARTTSSVSADRSASRSRIRWRSLRCTRWRTTDPPTAPLTTKPTRAPVCSAARARCTTTVPRAALRPRRTAVAKSSRRVSRAVEGSTAEILGRQADSCERPLRRRAVRIARPARVRIRSRNPCVLARRRLFGWKVRLPLLTAVPSPCAVPGFCGIVRSKSRLRAVGASPD